MNRGYKWSTGLAGTVFLIVSMTAGSPVFAGGTNRDHELMVYSIEEYSDFTTWSNMTYPWKNPIAISHSQDPYYDFWESMYDNCTASKCAHSSSRRRRNSEVTVNSMVAGADGWNDADMVFFWGHNSQMRQSREGMISSWKPHSGDGWKFVPAQKDIWGTVDEPYYFHRSTITDASYENAYAIFYAYNPLTSVLIGKDFTEGEWWVENTWDQRYGSRYTGDLSSDTEWIVAHGCTAVQAADNGHYPRSDTCTQHSQCYSSEACVNGRCSFVHRSNLAANAWQKSWGRLHIVLGHWGSSTPSIVPDLNEFAADLKAGATIKDAYFDMHDTNIANDPDALALTYSYGRGVGQPSAISVGSYDHCTYSGGRWVCPSEGGSGEYLRSETWTSPQSDSLAKDYDYFTYAYNVFVGAL